MTLDRWRQITDLFAAALARHADTRTAYLDEACTGDPALREEVDSLLEARANLGRRPELPLLRRVRLESSVTECKANHTGARDSDSFSAASKELTGLGDIELPHRLTMLRAGARLASGRLSIVRCIGRGGMGVVYDAFDAERNCAVALKTLTRLDAASIYRLKNEFRALADVRHENLVKLYELFSDDMKWFFTMELVVGDPFDRWVRPKGDLDETRLRRVLPQLVDAVSAIHASGKLHRDLKPNNVLVTRKGRAVVLDFGLAVDSELGGVGQTVTDDGVLGTAAYISPEQAAGKPATAACDVYEIGVMLFEGLTGRLPFEGYAGEMLAAKQRDAAPLASTLAAVPADLDALCAKLLAREPAARPNLAELRARLRMLPVSYESPAGSPLAASSDPTALLGRATELAELRGAFRASCTSDKPVIVLLSGESGIGKTTLCEAFRAEVRAQEYAVVFSGRCFERESVPFKAFDLLVDELSRYLRKLPERELLSVLPRDTYALRCLFPVLGRVEAIADSPVPNVRDPHELRRRAFLAFGELLGRMRDRRPLVLCLDDLQWSDNDSTLLLMHLVRQSNAPRLLLVASHRSEQMQRHHHLSPLYEVLPFDTRLDVRRLRLMPLPPEAARALLRARLGHVPEALARGAGGNPFFLGELGRYGCAHSLDSAADVALEDLVITRVAGLPDPQRKLIQILAVAARPIDLLLAVEAANVVAGPRTVFEALREAHLARAIGEGRLVECYHDKVREALLGSLAQDMLREHHGALARALATQADADAEQLAAHLLGAGEYQRAAEELVRAAKRAFAELGFDHAARLYACALEHGRFDVDELKRLCVARANALAEAGRGAESAEVYLAALEHTSGQERHALEHRAGDQYLYSGRLEQGRVLLARSLVRHGVRLRSSRAAAMASLKLERWRLRLRGLDFRQRPPDPASTERLFSLQNSARALGRLDFLRGADLATRYLRLALDAGDVTHVVIALNMEVWHRTLGIGDATEIPRLIARAEALLSRSDSVKARCWLHFCRGFYFYYRPEPDLEAAISDFDRFLELSLQRHYPNASYDRRMAEHNRMNALVQLGRVAEVARGLPALLDDACERGDFVVLPFLAGQNAMLAMIAIGALDDAQREFDRASRAWLSCGNAYSYQDYFLFAGSTYLMLARGDPRAAWLRAQRDLARFSKSPLRFSRPMADRIRMTAAGTAAALAARSEGIERATLMREARKLARGIPQNMTGGPLWATLAWLQGDPETAITILRETLIAAEGRRFPLHAHLIRRRLGELIGGAEGEGLVTEADAVLRTGGTVDPAHLAATCVMPAVELRTTRLS